MTQTSKSLLMLLAGITGLGALYAAESQARLPRIEYEGPAFTFTEIRDDVWVAIGTGNLTVMSNAGIIVNDEDVLVIDSHVSPAAAEALLEELKQITTKPVRYVVNSHGHFDHAHGNQIYPTTVEVIGHEYAHRMLATGASNRGRTWERYIGVIPATIERLRAQLDSTSAPAEREALERRLQIQESFKEATDAVVPTPPNLTLNDRMTLYRGGREIRIEFFGRGHTGGDIVVYLPEERILFTGDLIGQGISYLGDAFVPEYIETLEQLKSLDFETIVPGHGRPFTERERIDYYQTYLADFWLQVSELYASGVSAEDAARRIDMRAHAEHYPTIRSAGVDNESVDRAYELLAGLE
jgi:cyclase